MREVLPAGGCKGESDDRIDFPSFYRSQTVPNCTKLTESRCFSIDASVRFRWSLQLQIELHLHATSVLTYVQDQNLYTNM
jgi:hypothetical protein